MIALDSNVWIFYLDATTAEHERVREPVRDILSERPVFTNAVVPLEVVHYLRNRRRDSEPFVEGFLTIESTTVEPVDAALVQRADELLEAHPHAGIGGRDASLVAAMERHDVTELWTHDAGLKRLGERLDWLSVTDPVEP